MIPRPKISVLTNAILLLITIQVLHAQNLKLLIYKTDWDVDKYLPCCVSGLDWSENEQRLYFVSDQKDKVYKSRLEIRSDEMGGYELIVIEPESFSLRGIYEDCNLEAIRLNDEGDIFLSAERGDQHVESFLWKGKVVDDRIVLKELSLPKFFHGKVFNRNAGIEGISLSFDKKGLWIMNEQSLLGEPEGHLSLLLQDFKGNEKVSTYTLDENHIKNGVSEILCWDQTRILALERHYSTERQTVLAGIFLITVDAQKATRKKLLDLNALPIPHIDNYEGMCFGPYLKNGNRSLILISDNNQDWQKCKEQQTDLLVFEIDEK